MIKRVADHILAIAHNEKITLTFKVGRPRLELGTNRLKAEYSTIELATLFCFATLPS